MNDLSRTTPLASFYDTRLAVTRMDYSEAKKTMITVGTDRSVKVSSFPLFKRRKSPSPDKKIVFHSQQDQSATQMIDLSLDLLIAFPLTERTRRTSDHLSLSLCFILDLGYVLGDLTKSVGSSYSIQVQCDERMNLIVLFFNR